MNEKILNKLPGLVPGLAGISPVQNLSFDQATKSGLGARRASDHGSGAPSENHQV